MTLAVSFLSLHGGHAFATMDIQGIYNVFCAAMSVFRGVPRVSLVVRLCLANAVFLISI